MYNTLAVDDCHRVIFGTTYPWLQFTVPFDNWRANLPIFDSTDHYGNSTKSCVLPRFEPGQMRTEQVPVLSSPPPAPPKTARRISAQLSMATVNTYLSESLHRELICYELDYPRASRGDRVLHAETACFTRRFNLQMPANESKPKRNQWSKQCRDGDDIWFSKGAVYRSE